MLADPEDEMRLGDFIQIFHRKVETFYQETKLAEVLTKFKKGGTHMGLVREVNTSDDKRPVFEIRGVITLEDVIEEILQDEIVDETDVYKDVDNQVKVNDGREMRVLNLAVFNPLWKSRREQLSVEEVKTIAAHLERTCFGTDARKTLRLSFRAIEWLVTKSGVQNRKKATPHGIEDIREDDILYDVGRETDKCTLVLQGRVGIRAGRDGFRSEAGAFSVLALDALIPGENFKCDYRAYLQTEHVRMVTIGKPHFLEAQILDKDHARLSQAFTNLAPDNHELNALAWQGDDISVSGIHRNGYAVYGSEKHNIGL
jgi:metal transporter CNNM